MIDPRVASLRNGAALARDKVPRIPLESLRELVTSATERGRRVAALFGRSLVGQSESWPDRGPPERPTGWWPRWSAGRRSALRHWARAVHLAARGGYVIPASKGASQASWRLPPLHRPRAVREGLANLGRNAPREYGSLAV